MKKFLLFTKMLLMAAVLFVGSVNDAWADEVNITSIQSAFTDKGHPDTPNNGTTVDKLQLKFTQIRDWESAGKYRGQINFRAEDSKLPLYKFNLSEIKGITGEIISIKFEVTGYSSESSAVTAVRAVGYNESWDATTLTHNTLVNKGANESLPGTVSGGGSFQPLDNTSEYSFAQAGNKLSFEAKTYVVSAVEAEKDYVSIAVISNLGRTAYLETSATLIVTYVNSSVYTASFTEGNSLTPTVTIYKDSERTEVIDNGMLEDGNTYYYTASLANYYDYEGSFTVDGGNPAVEYTMTRYPSYTINAVAGETTIKQLANGYAEKDASYGVYLPYVILYNENYYVLDDDENEALDGFYASYTKGIADEVKEINYTLDSDIVAFWECESLSYIGHSWYSGGSSSNNSSLSSGASVCPYSGTSNGISTKSKLGEGVYDITIKPFYWKSDLATTYSLKYSSDKSSWTDIGSVTFAKESNDEFIAENKDIPDGSYLGLLSPDGTTPRHGLDYILVKKSHVSYTVEYKCGATTVKTADATRTSAWGTTVELTDDDMADITIDGKKYRYSSDNASSTTIASDGTSVITVNFEYVSTVSTVTYTLNVGAGSQTDITSTNTASTTNLTSLVGITNNTGSSYDTGGGKVDLTVKIPTDASYDADHYVSVGFTVAEGYKFTPTNISVKAQPVSTNKTVKFVLTDATNSIEKTQENVEQGKIATITENNDGKTSVTGDVTLKIYCYGDDKTYRLGSPISIEGLLDYADDIKAAVADCKTYETSSDFATYIDAKLSAGELTTVAKVYAAHSAWQIAQAKASGSTDYSKAIMNRTFELHNTNGWTIYGNASSTATSDNDKYGVVEYGEGWSQYYTGWNGRNVSQTIASLPAGTYRLSAKVYSTGNDGAYVRLFANGQLSVAEAGADHDPVLEFTVTGDEESIKIGIGGTGHEDDTDNTWGTWFYRVKNFTLTKLTVGVTVGANGYTTFASPYALDLTDIETSSLKAYKATLSGATLSFQKLAQKVPAGTGLLLLGETKGGTYTIPVADEGSEVDGNALTGVLEPVAKQSNTDGKYYFAMKKASTASDPLQFAALSTSKAVTVPAGKVYIEVDATAFGGSSRTLAVSFDDDDTTTGIKNVTPALTDGNNVAYDLQGRRVAAPSNGLYIVNGKKVIFK